METPPKVSVILSTYSRARSIGRAIDSILNQAFTEFELIILDDGSQDGTKPVIESYALKDSRIRWVRFEENSALPAKRYNNGMALARAPYFAFMFDDDVLFPNALGDLYREMEATPNCDMIYGLVNYIDARNGRCFGPKFGADWDWPKLCEHGNYLCNISVIVKKEAINAVGGYDEEQILRRLCDWDLWVRVGEGNKVRKVSHLIGEVWGFEPDSVGVKWPIEMTKIREHQKNRKGVALKGYWSDKKKVCFVTHGHDASLQRWRIDYLVEEINRREGRWGAYKVDLGSRAHWDSLSQADVLVFYRFYRSLQTYKKLGKKIIYDIDDYVFEPNGQYNNKHERELMLSSMSGASVITVSSEYLADILKPRATHIRKNAFPLSHLDCMDAIPRDKDNGRFRIGYIAGIGRDESNAAVLSILRGINWQGNFEFFCFGKNDIFIKDVSSIPNFTIDRRSYVKTDESDRFYSQIASKGLHCIINPLPKGDFFNAKSEIKFLEAASARVPIITSPRAMFRNLVDHGRTGFLAETTEDFVGAIRSLYDSPNLVKEIGDNANRYIRTFYDIEHVADEYVLFLDELVSGQHVAITQSPAVKLDQFGNCRGQFGHNNVIGEVKQKLTQGFLCDVDNLYAVEVMGATYKRANTSQLKVRLADIESGREVHSCIWECKDLPDNEWWRIEFDPIKESKGRKYQILFEPLNGSSRNYITLYALYGDPCEDSCVMGDKSYGILTYRYYAKDIPLRPDKNLEEENVKRARSRSVKPPMDGQKILIRRAGGLGDMVCLTPIIKEIRRRGEKINIAIETNFPSVFEGMDVAVLPYGQPDKAFDRIYDLSLAYEMDPKSHIVDKFSKMVFGIEIEDKSSQLFSEDEHEKQVTEMLHQNGVTEGRFVVIHPAVTWKNRTWPKDRWERIIEDLRTRSFQVVVVGSGGDFYSYTWDVVNLIGKLTPREVRSVIDRARLFIGTDSGVMHIAGSTSTPMVVLFTSTSPEYRMPYRDGMLGRDVVAVEPGIECQGCFHRCAPPVTYVHCARGDFLCLNMLSSAKVFDAVRRVLDI